MRYILLALSVVIVVYCAFATYHWGYERGRFAAFSSVSEQVDRGTLDLKGD